MVISIMTNVGHIVYTFIGGEAESIQESCETAAHQAVRVLMKTFEVYVEDITSTRWQEMKRCTALYQLKQLEKCIEKGKSKVELYENMLGETNGR